MFSIESEFHDEKNQNCC